jgi:hypothetical protein
VLSLAGDLNVGSHATATYDPDFSFTDAAQALKKSD